MKYKQKLSQEEIDRFYRYLDDYPGYKQLIRQRISDEQKRRRKQEFRFATRERALWKRFHPGEPFPDKRIDVDQLGREVEGCG